ncbi:MAG TPA: serine/threonine-protein kinase [Xanthomonadaceae bacterium]
MNHHPNDTDRLHADPADSVLLSLARAVAGGHTAGGASWPRLDLADPKQREFGDYELLEEIGRGGMGVVYRARQRSLDREVAIKFIADWFADADGVTRFLAEARAAARLLHPNIVPVHEVGTVGGLHYFSMPLIRGHSLATVLDAGTMPAADAIALLLTLCDAIDYAHRLGLLHLDLKPANVLLDARGEPQIADFGLARHMDERGGVDAQEVSGTPSFMAPEQILIKQYRLTAATDTYALGAILYRCLTGVSPHGEGSADDVIRRAAAGRIRAPREVNPKIARDLDAICMKCLELQPGDRYASAAQLADDLRRVRDGLPVSVRRIGIGERAQRWLRREPKLAAAVGLAALTLLIGAAATTWQWKKAAAERDRATIASEIGAHLFAYQGDADKRTGDLIDWLRKRLPGDEQRQADALAAFAASTSVAGSGNEDSGNLDDLLGSVIKLLGTNYRRQMIKSLQAGADPYRHVYAALLAWSDESDSPRPQILTASLQAAITEHPDDALVWQIAAVYCPSVNRESHCLFPQAAENLVRLDPGNGYDWLQLMFASTDAQLRREALHEAAQRTRFDDYTGAEYAAYAKAIETAAVPPPPLIARPARVLAPNERAESSIALLEAESIPLPAYQHLTDYCSARVGMPEATDPGIRADCLDVGVHMVRSKEGLMTQMIGVAMVTRLARDTPLAEEARRARRLYTYLDDTYEKLGPNQQMRYPPARWLQDIATVGEMAAFQRRARFFGLPDQPPVDWKPNDPTALDSTSERYDKTMALNRKAGLLVAQGKYAEAIALLAPEEATMRKHWRTGWIMSRYLMTLGKARKGSGDYAAAVTDLEDAFHISFYFPPESKDARDCAQALIDLYTAWNNAEPGKGYEAKADEWQKRLAGLAAAKDD